MTVIAMDESSTSTKPAWRWIALMPLFLAVFLITMTVYGVVYEREAKILVSEAEIDAQLANVENADRTIKFEFEVWSDRVPESLPGRILFPRGTGITLVGIPSWPGRLAFFLASRDIPGDKGGPKI